MSFCCRLLAMPQVGFWLSSLAGWVNSEYDYLTEHVTAVAVSVKDKLTLSLGVAVGSSIVS